MANTRHDNSIAYLPRMHLIYLFGGFFLFVFEFYYFDYYVWGVFLFGLNLFLVLFLCFLCLYVHVFPQVNSIFNPYFLLYNMDSWPPFPFSSLILALPKLGLPDPIVPTVFFDPCKAFCFLFCWRHGSSTLSLSSTAVPSVGSSWMLKLSTNLDLFPLTAIFAGLRISIFCCCFFVSVSLSNLLPVSVLLLKFRLTFLCLYPEVH